MCTQQIKDSTVFPNESVLYCNPQYINEKNKKKTSKKKS